MTKTKGWHGEKHRHSTARKGVKTMKASGKHPHSRSLTYDEWEALDILYNYEVPEYITGIKKSEISIRVTKGWGESINLTITPEDVIEYYHKDARNISSGIRTIAGFSGDWRHIDELAKESLEIYKVINREALIREADKHGMQMRG